MLGYTSLNGGKEIEMAKRANRTSRTEQDEIFDGVLMGMGLMDDGQRLAYADAVCRMIYSQSRPELSSVAEVLLMPSTSRSQFNAGDAIRARGMGIRLD